MIIHEHIPKRKQRKPNAKQRQLREDWEKLMKKYEPKTPVKAQKKTYTPEKGFTRASPDYPSVDTGVGSCAKQEQQKYTGTKMLGIGTMHKSNSVPIFSEDEAVEISRMRRG